MKIKSIKFIKGIIKSDPILETKIPQIAFIGRSNSGKSSLINSLISSKIARISSFPGRTQEINIFLINESFYLIDLPGYGFTKTSGLGQEKIAKLIDMYFFNSVYKQKKVILIIDANIGFTVADISMFNELKNHQKDIIIVANKIDRLNQSEYHKRITEIKGITGDYPVIPFSSTKYKGKGALIDEIF